MKARTAALIALGTLVVIAVVAAPRMRSYEVVIPPPAAIASPAR
jgi:hypothetical protein